MKITKTGTDHLVFSYLELRRAIGILGIALPFIISLGALIIFRTGIQRSISSYYHTGMRDVFVGILCVIGFFLLSYKGWDLRDDIAGDLACAFAVGLAFFPTAPDGALARDVIFIGRVHLFFATLFFAALIYFSLVLFTKTDPAKPPAQKKLIRNNVYRICGFTMIFCIVLIAAYYALPDSLQYRIKPIHPIFWLESCAIIAFGISWFVKGQAILKDEKSAEHEKG
ncbi:MAG: DUF998 domain-containing protein [Chitinivibrionales bacterium]|nr:DUF998 domain-containing protein [Chitinivibrionales bacterium]